jgi:hypothetical protein
MKEGTAPNSFPFSIPVKKRSEMNEMNAADCCQVECIKTVGISRNQSKLPRFQLIMIHT